MGEPGVRGVALTSASGRGAISLNKPSLSLLQTPVRILLGFDVPRCTNPFTSVTLAKLHTGLS